MSTKNETDLIDYKRDGKLLQPPLAQFGKSTSSWIDERLPDMLWAALVISQVTREEALSFFRYVLNYVTDKKELYNITLSGIGLFAPEIRSAFIKYILSYDKKDIKKILKPLLAFELLPARAEWSDEMGGDSITKEDWKLIVDAVRLTLGHQSQEATDCRWVKVAAMIISGKLSCPLEMAQEILGYPNVGDQRKVRPTIRATEIVPEPDGQKPKWPSDFWEECRDKTDCLPEQEVDSTLRNKMQEFEEELERTRSNYHEQCRKIRYKLIEHSLLTAKTTGVDSRHEAVFGIALYGFGIFVENIFYRLGMSINGRALLRVLFETYITLAYLVKKESEEPRVWDDFRSYGSGQANLIYRKFEEGGLKSSAIDKERIGAIANEDKWTEFVTINLGHWDSSDLRKMSEYVGEKQLYDKYYAYTSGFIHANWAAIRESIYQRCFNPLHRLHQITSFELPMMTTVTDDMIEMVNKILDLVSSCYPEFDPRISSPDHVDGESLDGEQSM